MTKQEWKDILRDRLRVSTKNRSDERAIRQAISELRKEGIIFIPNGDHYYINVDKVEIPFAKDFAKAQKRAWLTQYVNTIKPLERFLDEEDKKELYGVLV